LVLLEGADQVGEKLDGQIVFVGSAFEGDEYRVMDAAQVHVVQLFAPPGQQAQAFGGVADLVAEVVSPAAEGVDVVEILMQPLGQQERDHVEIFVMPGGQPTRIPFGRRLGVSIAQRLRRVDILFGGEQRHYGMMAVFM